MSKKYNYLDEISQKEIDGLVGLYESEYGGPHAFHKLEENENTLKTKLGICYDCNYLHYCKNELDEILARCDKFKIQLRLKAKMLDCTNHKKRNEMSLWDMKEIAYIIENKNKPGFNLGD